MADNKIEIEIVLDDGSIQRGFATVRKEAKRTQGFFKKNFVNPLSSSFSRLGRSLSSLLSPLKSFIAVLVSGEAIRRSIKAFADFETGLVGVAKTTNLSDQNLQALSDQIEELTKVIPRSSSSLLELAEAAGQIGVRSTSDILKFVETFARLSATTNVAGAEASRSIVRIINITGESVSEVGKFGAILTELGNRFETIESQILSTANEVAKASAQFSVSSEQVLAISTALRVVGAEAAVSGSTISRIFIEIDKALVTGGDRLQLFAKITGLTVDELRKQFEQNAGEVFLKFINGLDKARRSGTKLITNLTKLSLANIRTLKVIPPLVIRVDKLNKAFRLAGIEAKTQTALIKESNKAFNTLSSDLTLLGNAISRLGKAIGEELAPSFRELVRDTTSFVNLVKDVLIPTIKATALEIKISILSVIKDLLFAFNNSLPKSFNKFGDAVKESVINNLVALTASVNSAKLELLNLVTASTSITILDDALDKTKGKVEEVNQSLIDTGLTFEQIKTAFINLSTTFKIEAKSVALVVRNAFVKGFSQAFVAVGRALATGQNGFKAFGKSVLNTIGALAIQLGQFFILIGFGLTATGPLLKISGAAAIAAGAALTVFGGALQALSGGGAVGGAGGAGAGGGGVVLPDTDLEPDQLEKPGTEVNINVEGTVLSPRDVGLQIAEILRETFETTDATVIA